MNDENLKVLTPSEAREQGRKGGIRSGEVRRERRKMREYLEAALVMDADLDGETVTNAEAVTVALVKAAKKGSVRAYETILGVLGEKPADTVKVEHPIPQSTYDEIERLLGLED